jgi:nickel/cobalt exporter
VAVAALVGLLFALSTVLGPSPALAHPLGNFTVNRYSGLQVAPGGVFVDYVLDMAEIPAFQERLRIDTDADEAISGAERQAWANRTAREVLAGLSLTVGGWRVSLGLSCARMDIRPGQGGLDTIRMEATFAGALPGPGRVVYRDGNEPGRLGWREIVVGAIGGARVADSSVPAASTSRELFAYPSDRLSTPLRVTEATFSYSASAAPGAQVVGQQDACGGREDGVAPVPTEGFAGLVGRDLSPGVLVVSVLMAFLFGAFHALGPGHGKTIMAAYLVGGGAPVRQAAKVGMAVTLMHTASVLVLGGIALSAARLFPSEAVYPWLGAATGIVIVGLGIGLLVSRLRVSRRERRKKSPRHHPDSHPHPHPHPGDPVHHPGAPLSKRGLAALAVSGGVMPSPTALVVLLGAVALHRVAYGVVLIAAFSVGLAAALFLVGAVALRARSFAYGRLNPRLWNRIPLASAGIILVVGVALTARAALALV